MQGIFLLDLREKNWRRCVSESLSMVEPYRVCQHAGLFCSGRCCNGFDVSEIQSTKMFIDERGAGTVREHYTDG